MHTNLEEAVRLLNAEGWAVVPRVATAEMIREAWAACWESNAEETWREMVEAGEIKVSEETPAA